MVNEIKREQYHVYYVAARFERWFDRSKKFTFFSALFVGIATHYLQLVNQYLSQDGIVSSVLCSAGDFEASLGRWGIDYIDSLRNNAVGTALISVWCLILMACGVVLMTDLLKIRQRFSLFFIAAAFMTAPSLLATMLYSYCADAYIIAFDSAILSAYCLVNIKNRLVAFAGSSVFLVLSLAIYQNYAGITAGIYVILVLQSLLNEEEEIKEIVKRVLYDICAFGMGGVFYYALSKIICHIRKIELSGKGGFGGLSPVSVLRNLKGGIVTALKDFRDYFFCDNIIFNTSWHRGTLYSVFFIVCLLALLLIVYKKKIYQKPLRLVLVFCCAGVFPFALNAIFLLTQDSKVYSLNAMQMMLVFPLLFVLLEHDGITDVLLVPWCGVLISAVIVFTYFSADIFSYEYMGLAYGQMESLTNRVVDRMENTEGYYPGMPCTIVGIPSKEDYPLDGVFQKYSIGDILDTTLFHTSYGGSLACWKKFAVLYLGENLQMSEYTGVIGTDEFKEMGIYPAQDSVQIIDGIMTVKFTDDPALP